jgi:hypothetical protein
MAAEGVIHGFGARQGAADVPLAVTTTRWAELRYIVAL